MVCYHPIEAWHGREVNANGKRPLVFIQSRAAQPDAPIKIPCGQCIGCRLERSRQWAVRCLHEASLYEDNCFITLTFNDDQLYERSKPWSLDKTEFQRFMKRVRKAYPDLTIRYFHCGEYGEICKRCMKSRHASKGCCTDDEFARNKRVGRPHYHALLFNLDFADKQIYMERNGHYLYTSDQLTALWPHGFSSIGDVTFESAAYVARYVMKKITGDQAQDHYNVTDWFTGENYDVEPEYTTMSRRPGIATGWFEKYKDDVYPNDYVVLSGGRKVRPPKFYDRLLEAVDPFTLDWIKEDRERATDQHYENNTKDRLKVREYIQYRKLNQLVRNLDD